MRLILYTGTHCPKCPGARVVVREAARDLGMVEGVDFVEKLIDGQSAPCGKVMNLDGMDINIVSNENEITKDNVPAALGGEDLTIDALMHQVAATPAIVIDDELAFAKTPTKEELVERLKQG